MLQEGMFTCLLRVRREPEYVPGTSGCMVPVICLLYTVWFLSSNLISVDLLDFG